MFADDTSLFYAHKDIKVIEKVYNEELQHISDWLCANKLSLNVKKSKVLFYRPNNGKQKADKETIQLKIDGTDLEEVASAKYLGMYFDNKLNFAEHIQHIKTKLNKGNAILAKLRHFVPEETVKNVYHAHIESHLLYGLITWGSAPKSSINNIISKQKKAIKIMKFVKKREHIDHPFKNNKMLPLPQLRALSMAKLFWKCLNDEDFIENVPNIQEMITFHGIAPNDRDPHKFVAPAKRTRQARQSIFYLGIREWNKIPLDIKSSTSLGSFKNKLKSFIFPKLSN